MSTIDKFNEHVMHTYGRLPIVLEKGSGRQAEAPKQHKMRVIKI